MSGGVRSPLTIIDRTGKGCEVGAHADAVPQEVTSQVPKPAATSRILTVTESKEGKEVFQVSGARTLQPQASALARTPVESVPPSFLEEEDDPNVAVAPGTECRRKGCTVNFVSDADNRVGNGEGTVCTYHPAPVRF